MYSAAILGTSKIANIHLRELLRKKIKKIFIVSRKRENANLIIKKNYQKNSKLVYCSIKDLKKKKVNLISICTNTESHFKILKYLKYKKAYILVEKPIFSIDENSQYELKNKLKQVYKFHDKLIVMYPMLYFGRILRNRFFHEKKIKTVCFKYYTNGKNTYSKIAEDLLPHAFSFFYSICNIFYHKHKFQDFLIKKIINKKFNWRCSLILNKVNFSITFKENSNLKKSYLEVLLNNKKIIRKTKQIENKFVNSILYKKKEFIIKNPMEVQFDSILKNLNNIQFFNYNKHLTEYILNISTNLIK